MKITKFVVIAMLAIGFQPAYSAPFCNLGFEEALIGPDFMEISGPIKDLLPGWNVTLGGQPLESVGFNFCLLDAVDCASLGHRDFTYIEGMNTIWLLDNPNFTRLSLTQTGDIPINAYYLQYTYVGGPPRITINGETVGGLFPFHRESQDPRTVQVEVSKFAGQSVELGFHSQYGGFITTPSTEIDAISFVVPEPSTLALGLVAGGLFAGAHLWRKRSKR